MPHGRFIELCAPIEIRNEQDLIVLANLVRKLLKHETTLEQVFPHYVYAKDNWVAKSELKAINCGLDIKLSMKMLTNAQFFRFLRQPLEV